METSCSFTDGRKLLKYSEVWTHFWIVERWIVDGIVLVIEKGRKVGAEYSTEVGNIFQTSLDNSKVLCLGVGFLGVGSGGGGVLVVEEEEEEDGKFCILAGEEETPWLVVVPGAGYGRNTARPALLRTTTLPPDYIFFPLFVFFFLGGKRKRFSGLQ